MRFILYAILAYVLYQFIFKLVIPVYLASRKIKRGFKEMNARMQSFESGQDPLTQQQSSAQQPNASQPAQKPKGGDYIDFEEVK
jgi:hypothetical protein